MARWDSAVVEVLAAAQVDSVAAVVSMVVAATAVRWVSVVVGAEGAAAAEEAHTAGTGTAA